MGGRRSMAKELVFLTGGTGFLGKHLVPLLLKNQYEVRILVRQTSDVSWLPKGKVDLVYGDVTDKDFIITAMEGCQFVIHAAAYFRFWGPHEVFDRINVTGTKNVVEAAQKNGVKRYVHISTIAVVGNPKRGEPIDEEIDCCPQDAYQHSKLTAERYVHNLAEKEGFPALILRPGAFYGPGSFYGLNRMFVVEPMGWWRVKVNHGKRFTFPVYVPDAANAIVSSLESGRVGEIYNISGESCSHEHLNNIVSNYLGISLFRFPMPRFLMIGLALFLEIAAKLSKREPYYPLNLRYYIFNDWNVISGKAKDELGFIPTSPEDGWRETVNWIKKVKNQR